MRTFIHMDFLNEQVPDTIILLHFRYLMDADKLGENIRQGALGKVSLINMVER